MTTYDSAVCSAMAALTARPNAEHEAGLRSEEQGQRQVAGGVVDAFRLELRHDPAERTAECRIVASDDALPTIQGSLPR